MQDFKGNMQYNTSILYLYIYIEVYIVYVFIVQEDYLFPYI